MRAREAAGRVRRPPHRLDEFTFIDLIRDSFGAVPPEVLAGIGDDAAVVRSSGQTPWLFTTDILVEGVHFSLATTGLEDLGFKAGAANLSDIAAMAASPRYLLVDVAIPPSLPVRDMLRFYRGLSRVCRPHRVAVIGGDTSGSPGGLFIAVTAIGQASGGRAVLRRGASPGDHLMVSGTLGDAMAGLDLLGHSRRRPHRSVRLSTFARRTLIRRHHRPTPRIALGLALGTRHLATAMIDLSDGLSGDLPHLCRRSHVGALVDPARLPTSAALRAYAKASGQSPAALALQGGEDYELLFTVAPKHRTAVQALGRRLRVPVSEIGRIMPESFGRQLRLESGSLAPLPVTSYRHF